MEIRARVEGFLENVPFREGQDVKAGDLLYQIENVQYQATGAGALSRRAVGTPVFGGMIAAALFGIFVIPLLYVVFPWLRERSAPEASHQAASAATD